jgi:hypothetical protein
MWFAYLLPVAPVHTLPSDSNIYKYMPHALKHIYCISHIATSLAVKIVARTYGVILIFLNKVSVYMSMLQQPVFK